MKCWEFNEESLILRQNRRDLKLTDANNDMNDLAEQEIVKQIKSCLTKQRLSPSTLLKGDSVSEHGDSLKEIEMHLSSIDLSIPQIPKKSDSLFELHDLTDTDDINECLKDD